MPRANSQNPPIIIHDNDDITYANQSLLSLLSIDSREDLLDTSLCDFVTTSDRGALQDQFNRVEADMAPSLGLTVTLEVRNRQISGVIAVTSQVNWDGQEQLETIFIDTNAPITAGLSATTMDNTPVGITIADARETDMPLIYVNDQFVEMTGYSREEVLGRNCRFLQGKATKTEPVRKMRQAINNGEAVTVELRNYRKEGQMFWNRVSIYPVTNESGDVTHFLGYQEDISERKAYQQEKTLFEMQAELVDKMVFITDSQAEIEYVNPQFEQTTGYTAAEAIGNTPQLFKSDAHDDAFFEGRWKTITAGEVREATVTNKRKTGERFNAKQKIVPIANENDEITHYVAIEEDITDSQFVEEVLDVMNRVLRHNLRNSLSAIEGYAKKLERDGGTDENRAALQMIQERASQLRQTSEKAKDIRALFRRRNEGHTIRIAQIIEDLSRMTTEFPDASIKYSTEISDEREIRNGGLLQIAISEAVENAVVHNDQDQPSVEVVISDNEKTNEIEVQISDNGPGIPQQEWDVIYSGGETPLTHGTGIGVWLMYWAVTALGGTLELSETGPEGSMVTFTVPTGMNQKTV